MNWRLNYLFLCVFKVTHLLPSVFYMNKGHYISNEDVMFSADIHVYNTATTCGEYAFQA